jgi:hypothetical protein
VILEGRLATGYLVTWRPPWPTKSERIHFAMVFDDGQSGHSYPQTVVGVGTRKALAEFMA